MHADDFVRTTCRSCKARDGNRTGVTRQDTVLGSDFIELAKDLGLEGLVFADGFNHDVAGVQRAEARLKREA